MATADTRHSIVITKSFGYRGVIRTFSNRYHFEGALPPDDTHWGTLADAIVLVEKTIYASAVTIVQATGYDSATATSTNPHGDAVFTKLYTTTGTFTPAMGDVLMAGDCCALLRYATTARSSKNHPVYLFNYFHGVYRETGTTDTVSPTQSSAIAAYGSDWVTGFSDGSITHERCGPRGAVSVSSSVNSFVRHRDFPA